MKYILKLVACFTYQNAYLNKEDAIDSTKVGSQGILGITTFFLFHFHLALNSDTTGAEDSYPVLKLQIPKLKENDKIDYDTVIYRQ